MGLTIIIIVIIIESIILFFVSKQKAEISKIEAESTKSVKEMFDETLLYCHLTVLKPLGWKKDGSNFRFIGEDGLCKVINFQKNKHNTKDLCEFFINMSVYIEKGQEIQNKKFHEWDGQVRKRTCTEGGIYRIETGTNLVMMQEKISNIIKEEVLPFFGNFTDREEFIKILLSGDAQKYSHTNCLNYDTCKLLSDMGYKKEVLEIIKTDKYKKSDLFRKLAVEISSEISVDIEWDMDSKEISTEELYALIEEMCDKTPYTNSADSISWNAHRKAEKVSDPSIFPRLKEIIRENDHKTNVSKRNVRDAAYFIGGKLLQKFFDNDFCNFFIQRLDVESNKHILGNMLDRLAELDIVKGFDIEPILKCAKSEQWLIRQSAISALGSFDTNESRECLRAFVKLDDEKKYEYEIFYALGALGRIGEKEDIELVQMHIKSRKRDIKESACSVQEHLKEKYRF